MQNEKGDYNRPRRPSSDTIAYLRSLPLDLATATVEIGAFLEQKDNSSAEYPVGLAAALQALYEIRNELASLAGEEHAAEAIEVLCRITVPQSEYAARLFLESIVGYGLFLSSHRYGSHVVQTILQLTAKTTRKPDDLALDDRAPPIPDENVASIKDLVLRLVDELVPAATDLAVHLCGSHVLRSLLCLLGGVEIIDNGNKNSQRRGKAKSKKKKKNKPVPEETSNHGINSERMCWLSNSTQFKLDEDWKNALRRFTTTLTVDTYSTTGPGDLQRLACHSSAGPTVTVLLQILTYSDNPDAESNVRDQQQQWEVANASAVDSHRHLALTRPDLHYRPGLEAHALVKRLLCWKDSDVDAQPFAFDVIYGLAGEARGSHCLEIILRLSPDSFYADIVQVGKLLEAATLRDYVQDDFGNFVVQTMLTTVRNESQATAIFKALMPVITSGEVLDPLKKRRGILWRLAELAASSKGNEHQRQLLDAISTGFTALSQDERFKSGEAKLKWNKCIPQMLNMKKPVRDGDRLTLDVAGTRALHHILRFEPHICKDTIKGIMELSPEEIEALSKDAFGSRCILDGLLEGPFVKDPVFAGALRRLLAKLQGRWVALATDRVGHHTVLKLFRKLANMSDRETLVKELAEGKNRMRGNSMGRCVMEAVDLREYESSGAKEWHILVKKKLEKIEWLCEIVGEDEQRGVASPAHPKRNAPVHSENKTSKKSRRSFDRIMDAASIPTIK